ncbi:hypothetical protein [Pedobacter terrae]|uniref:hypothetical protein n=1 Tax=Pedobacter terrae TaxID=405671 RepID=UPI002FF479B8
MNFKKTLSIVIGFGTIGLLSSALAKLQGFLFPASLQLFKQATLTDSDTLQLIIKLACVYTSCIAGGIITELCGGENRQQRIVAFSLILIIIWLWISTIHPFWFWALLLMGILPFVLIGDKIKKLIDHEIRNPTQRS